MISEINRKELIDLLGKLVSFDTVNDLPKNKKLTKDCPEFIVNYLKEKGVKAEIFDEDGFYSVFGKIGDGKFHLLLMAHFDVVPVSDGWDSDPFKMTVKEGIAFGRGTIDNKNNVASIMTILPEIQKLNLGDKMSVCFELSGDEEIGGVHSAGNYHKKFGRMPDVVMNLDGAGTVIISRRRNAMGATITIPKRKTKIKGTLVKKTFTSDQWGRHTAYQNPGGDVHCMIRASREVTFNAWKVAKCTGKFIKGNVVPDEISLEIISPSMESDAKEYEYDEGLTAIFENLRFLIRTQFPTEFSTFGITIGPNVLSENNGNWELSLDIRAMTQEYDKVEAALREMCDELFGEKQYQLDFKPGQGMVNTPKNAMIMEVAVDLSKKYGFPAKIVEMGGASDARYFSREGIPTFDFGPIGGGVHASNEWLDMESFYKVTNFYLEAVKRIMEKV
ncbi:MAG TPA: M20/M25/M40 family metallo-hydrolase [candidate division Zixibacteria bacterium]|nr:M20/M25/M40 family metallo-hydrolase [candidate division Zixibacteria bacterium]